jgi:hypothetical protein
MAVGSAYVRVNQVGYASAGAKQAIALASGVETGATFSVVRADGTTVFSAPVGPYQGSWSSAYPDTYLLDFSALRAAGSYTIQVHGPLAAGSPIFRIAGAASLYGDLLPHAEFFFQAQHDGPEVNPRVMKRRPSHLTDAAARIYETPTYRDDALRGGLTRVGGPIDVSGGWFDAGDYVKLVQTASYVDAVMLFAARQYPALLDGGGADFLSEGRYGLDWLQKLWDAADRILYYQVGIGDGNGSSILGDHDIWRLPQADDAMRVKPGDPAYYVKYRPVFRVGPSGAPISPNLAGRLAADFGLCYQLFHRSQPVYAARCLLAGESVFDLARTSNVGRLLTAAPYDYYPETAWRDDMELGATELYLALASGDVPAGLPHRDPMYYLQRAAHWANAYISSTEDGADTLNLYDVSGLAHYELYRAIAQAGKPTGLVVDQTRLLADLRRQAQRGVSQARSDPFGLGIAYGAGDATPHALGLALEARLYDQLSGTTTYDAFATTELNWVLGENAWGASFIVGAGSAFPRCMQHQVANLAGSLDGTPPIVLGATTDGPNSADAFTGLGLQDGMRACPSGGGDPFKRFNGKGAQYMDNVIAWPSVEPADDYTVIGVPLFALLVASSGKRGS